MDNGNAVGLRTENGDIKLDRIKSVEQDDSNTSYDGTDFNKSPLHNSVAWNKDYRTGS
ncbi:MAG: hypothetical protein ACOX8H_08245 [Ruminococcus sp.]|jgi:hypothetical protein